jgi:hypothetical protein
MQNIQLANVEYRIFILSKNSLIKNTVIKELSKIVF